MIPCQSQSSLVVVVAQRDHLHHVKILSTVVLFSISILVSEDDIRFRETTFMPSCPSVEKGFRETVPNAHRRQIISPVGTGRPSFRTIKSRRRRGRSERETRHGHGVSNSMIGRHDLLFDVGTGWASSALFTSRQGPPRATTNHLPIGIDHIYYNLCFLSLLSVSGYM